RQQLLISMIGAKMEEVSSTDGENILRRLRVVTVICILLTWSFAYWYSAAWGDDYLGEYFRIAFGVQYHHFAYPLLPLIPDVLIAVLVVWKFLRQALLPFSIGILPLAFVATLIGFLWMHGDTLVQSLAVLFLASRVALVVVVWRTFEAPENWGTFLTQALGA